MRHPEPRTANCDNKALHLSVRTEVTGNGPDGEDATAVRVRQLSKALDRGTYQLIMLLPAFDREKGWAMDDQRSCAAWLNAYCGISPSAANDRCRVGYALEKLPVIRQLFEHGELSWSKVRALTRIATPENESELASKALHMTASDIERYVRSYRDVSSLADIINEDEKAAKQNQNRSLNCWLDHDGMVRINARLAPLEGVAFMKSLNRAEDVLFDEAGGEQLDSVQRSARQLRADALGLMAMKHLAAESTEVRTADRYQVVVHVDAATLHQTADNPDPVCGCRGERASNSLPLKCHVENGPIIAASVARKLADDCSVLTLFEKHGQPLSIGRKSRVWPTAISRAILHRDNGCCQFPGCSATRHLQLHHLKHWVDGGETSVDNGVTVCSYHHRLIHEGKYTVKKTPLDKDGRLPKRVVTVTCSNGQSLELTSSMKRFKVFRSDGSVVCFTQ